MSYMFCGCYHLSSVSEYSKDSIIELNNFIYENNLDPTLIEEVNFNIDKNKSDIFYNENNQLSLAFSSINKENSSNFGDEININKDYCPISFIKINKIYYMNHIFAGCISLISIPDIS